MKVATRESTSKRMISLVTESGLAGGLCLHGADGLPGIVSRS
jgi:hypothetical protein